MPEAEEVRTWMAGTAPGDLLKIVRLKTEDTHPSSRVMVILSDRDITQFAYKNTHIIKNKTSRGQMNFWWLNIQVSFSGFALPLTHHIHPILS